MMPKAQPGKMTSRKPRLTPASTKVWGAGTGKKGRVPAASAKEVQDEYAALGIAMSLADAQANFEKRLKWRENQAKRAATAEGKQAS